LSFRTPSPPREGRLLLATYTAMTPVLELSLFSSDFSDAACKGRWATRPADPSCATTTCFLSPRRSVSRFDHKLRYDDRYETTKHSTTKNTSLTNISPAATILVLLSIIFETWTVFNITHGFYRIAAVFTQNNINIIYGFRRRMHNIIFTNFFFPAYYCVVCRRCLFWIPKKFVDKWKKK